MGLSNAVSGGIIMFVILYVIMTFPTVLDAFSNVTQASSTSSKIENSILKTNIQIGSANATSLYNTVNFTLNNSGNEKLWNYDKFTVVISYDGGVVTKNRFIEQINYENTCTSNVDKWCITRFVNDLQDPQILNSNESVIIKCNLNSPIYTNGIVTVSVSTDNGVIASKSFTAS
ncbi:MAG: hypothetical protein HY222_02025 [Thaumarchaeota archaeon]|nr:hypothetical protein [Nitrososphaerota archaeon]MBI3641150.1 hypothetical protein [Nitrososphaerota archaeon]